MPKVRQRNTTFVYEHDEKVPAVLIPLGWLVWHVDEPDWIEWQREPLEAEHKARGFVAVPCWINSQMRR